MLIPNRTVATLPPVANWLPILFAGRSTGPLCYRDGLVLARFRPQWPVLIFSLFPREQRRRTKPVLVSVTEADGASGEKTGDGHETRSHGTEHSNQRT